MTKNKSIGLGLIGCGDFGRFCMEAFSGIEGVKPAAVADIVPPAADAMGKALGVPAFHSPEELIACEAVDVVHIATPPSSHYDIVMSALEAGKHILCEKPLAMDNAQATEMVEKAQSKKLTMPVNFVLRYNDVVDTLKAVIDSGALGKVLRAQLTNCASDHKLMPKHWFWNKSISGGIFIEHSVHFFDLYRHLLGDGEVIFSHTESRESDGIEMEDRAMCSVRHDSGTIASQYHCFDQPLPMDRTNHRLVCEMGDIFIEGWIPLEMRIDAVVNEESLGKLIECCPDCDVEVIEEYAGRDEPIIGRSLVRDVDRRICLTYVPTTEKQAVYAQSVRDLFADQIAFIKDPSHAREVTETNGLDAVRLAEKATKLAQES